MGLRKVDLLPPTVQPVEIIWMISPLLGLWLWGSNFKSAVISKKAMKIVGGSKAGKLYSSFAVESTGIMIFVELGLCLSGLLAMAAPANPASPFLIKYVLAGIFIFISLALTYKAFRWRVTDTAVRSMEE